MPVTFFRILYSYDIFYPRYFYFGFVERFSVFAATGYNTVLGIELYRMKF